MAFVLLRLLDAALTEPGQTLCFCDAFIVCNAQEILQNLINFQRLCEVVHTTSHEMDF